MLSKGKSRRCHSCDVWLRGRKMVPETQCVWTQIHRLPSQIAFGLDSFHWSCPAVLILSCTWLPSPTFSPSLAGVLWACEVAACCPAWTPAPLLMWGKQPSLLPDMVYTWLRFHWKNHNAPLRRKWNIPIQKHYVGWVRVNRCLTSLTFIKIVIFCFKQGAKCHPKHQPPYTKPSLRVKKRANVLSKTYYVGCYSWLKSLLQV